MISGGDEYWIGSQKAKESLKDFPCLTYPAYYIIFPSINERSTSMNEKRQISVYRECWSCCNFDFPYSGLIHEWKFYYSFMNEIQ